MYQIRPWLYTGSYAHAQNHPLLQAHGIDSLLEVYRPIEYPDIVSLYLEVEDGFPLFKKNIQRAVEFIHEQQQQHKTLLIACGAGISRSSTFAILALREIEGLSLEEGFWVVRAANPQAMPDETHWESLRSFYGGIGGPFWDVFKDAEM
ncbi:MAG: dual specificity protein phosphatase family protein [Anaerolineae bacterium]|jgi:protein-tyrosine phosphatase|nr:dual specificity protein phosphatase family protein [Anaerolineae bacterium]